MTLRSVCFSSLVLVAAGCTGTIDGVRDGADAGIDPDAGSWPEGDDPDAGSAPGEPRLGRVFGTGGVLRLRAEPSTSAEVLSRIPEHGILTLFGEPADGWYAARHDGHDGFVRADLVFLLEPGAEPGGVLNLLPWKPGKRFRVNQAHGGFSHNDTSYWAWDFDLPVGAAVLAAHNGVVRLARGGSDEGCCDRSCGPLANYVIVERGDGTESAYLHLSEVLVSKGDLVTRGQLIGKSGETGYVCGAHLHFQMQEVPADRTSRYSQSVQSFFHDKGGEPFDPTVGTSPLSRNGTLDLP